MTADIWQTKGILSQITEVVQDNRMTVIDKLKDIEILVKTWRSL